MLTRKCLLGMVAVAVAATANVSAGIISDSFDDGVIDTSLWSYGGRRTSWTSGDEGSWTWSHDETSDDGDPDGYLRMRVIGPTSGNSYGAVAWLRTTHNYNDGLWHLINFTWQARVSDDHSNRFFIQVNDGFVPSFADEPGGGNTFIGDNAQGSLLWSGGFPYAPYYSSTGKQSRQRQCRTHSGRSHDASS